MGTTSAVKESELFDVKRVELCIVISLLSWPICYIVNTGIKSVDEDKRALVLMSVGFVAFATIIFVVKTLSKVKNWVGYVLVLFAFASMADLIIAIEFKGWIKEFMTDYLQIGEPYFNSPWRYAVTLFDGLCFYTMYLMPYVVIPIFIGIRLFSKEKEKGWSTERIKSNGLFFDLIVVIGLIFSIWLIFVKGMLSIGSQFKIFQDILSHGRAPLGMDPPPYSMLQGLIFLFYSIPILITSLVCIFRKRKSEIVWDFALINGGLILHGQFNFIVTTLDWQFWINNLTLLIAPQLLLWNWYRSKVEVAGGTNKRKKNN